MRGLAVDQRQVYGLEQRFGRPPLDGRRTARRLFGRGLADRGIGARRLHRPNMFLAHLVEPQQRLPAERLESHEIAGLQRKTARRQREGSGLARHRGLDQQRVGDPLRLAGT